MPVTIANALDVPVGEVVVALSAMEQAGHAIRDAATGRQTGWHRGTRLPSAPVVPTVNECDEWTLY